MKVIFGGGITGLVWAYYNPDYFVITEDIGGQMRSKFSIGPRYLHYTPNGEKLLTELEVPVIKRKVRVGYIDDSGWVENPNLEFRQKYFMKSRNTSKLDGFDSTIMNSNQTEFSILEVDMFKLVVDLFDRVHHKVIEGKVSDIDLNRKLFTYVTAVGFVKTGYEKLVSTIPLNVFCSLAHYSFQEEFKSYGMTYCLMPKTYFDMRDFDFVYDARKTTKAHRLTKDPKGIVLDFFGEVGSINNEAVYLKNSQIISIQNSPKFDNVKLVGRYGTWNRKWKTEMVIDEAIKYYEQNNLAGPAQVQQTFFQE